MAEPRSDWGQELKRDVARLEERMADIDTRTSEIGRDVKELTKGNASTTTSIRLIWGLVVLLLTLSSGASFWTAYESRVATSSISENTAKLQRLEIAAKDQQRATTRLESEMHKLTVASDAIDKAVAAQQSTVSEVASSANKLLTAVSDAKTVAESAKTLAAEAKVAAEAAKKVSLETKSVAEETLVAASAKPSVDLSSSAFTILATLSDENQIKKSTRAGWLEFAVALPKELTVATYRNPLREIRGKLVSPMDLAAEYGVRAVAIDCALNASNVTIWLLPTPSPDALDGFFDQKRTMYVEVGILTDPASSKSRE